MYRFDMILDDVLNLYLLEVNQSPNIYAAENRVGNRQMFNHMLYNMINLIGTESPLKRKSIKTM